MKCLGPDVYSHLSDENDGGDRHSNKLIRLSKPKRVTNYPKLVQTIARIQYYNPEYSLFFRGQAQEYTLDSGATSMYPSIYRIPGGSLSTNELLIRTKKLAWAEKLLLEKFMANGLAGYDKLTNFSELCWAILQHYEVCGTPLLDITRSLQAAASFALRHDPATGILYVLGFPHVNASISYYVEEELLNIKLLSICPPEAQRPYFQEGFLIGTFPSKANHRHKGLDVACRLIAKFIIGWGTPDIWNFWGNNYAPIPDGALFPEKDKVERICNEIKGELDAIPESYWGEVASVEQTVEEEVLVV